jgi:hypothetical protein
VQTDNARLSRHFEVILRNSLIKTPAVINEIKTNTTPPITIGVGDRIFPTDAALNNPTLLPPEVYPESGLHPNDCLIQRDYGVILARDCPHIPCHMEYGYTTKEDLWTELGKYKEQYDNMDWYIFKDDTPQPILVKGPIWIYHNTAFCIVGGSMVEDIYNLVKEFPDFQKEFFLRGKKDATTTDIVQIIQAFELDYTRKAKTCVFMVIPSMRHKVPAQGNETPFEVDRANKAEISEIMGCLNQPDRNRIFVATPHVTSGNIRWYPLDTVALNIEYPYASWRAPGFVRSPEFNAQVHPHASPEWYMAIFLADHINELNAQHGFEPSWQHLCHCTIVRTGEQSHYKDLIKSHFKTEYLRAPGGEIYANPELTKMSYLEIGRAHV